MKTRKTKSRKTKKVRKGGNDATQFARRHGMWSFASTKDAAIEIKNIYAKFSKDQLYFGKHKPEIYPILAKNFGPSFFTPKQRIVKELRKFILPGGPDVSPKNIYFAVEEIDNMPNSRFIASSKV